MHRIILCQITALFLLMLPSSAQQTAAAKITGTEWNLNLQADIIHLDVKTSSNAPQQAFSASPSFLQLTFPQTKLVGPAKTIAIDKGLVQKIQLGQDGSGSFARVYVLTKPKATLTKTAQGYRYTLMLNEPASAQPRSGGDQAKKAQLPAQDTKLTAPATAVQNKGDSKPVPTTTKSTSASKSEVSLHQNSTPAIDPVTANPPATVTAIFKGKPLNVAIQEIAKEAGYQAEIDPEISGSVSLSLSAVPWRDALAMLLEPYGSSIALSIVGKTITVSKVGHRLDQDSGQGDSTSESKSVLYEYFPLQTKNAEKMMEALQKAVPEVSYRVDPVLNILLVAGQKQDIIKVSEFLKTLFKK